MSAAQDEYEARVRLYKSLDHSIVDIANLTHRDDHISCLLICRGCKPYKEFSFDGVWCHELADREAIRTTMAVMSHDPVTLSDEAIAAIRAARPPLAELLETAERRLFEETVSHNREIDKIVEEINRLKKEIEAP